MSIILDGTTGITTPDVTADSYTGPLNVSASAPDNSVVVDVSGNLLVGGTTVRDSAKITNEFTTGSNGLALYCVANINAVDFAVFRANADGFIAHELAEVCPSAVVGDKDTIDSDGNPKYQSVDTSFLVATLTAAIQELNAKVDAQAAEIAALKGTV